MRAGNEGIKDGVKPVDTPEFLYNRSSEVTIYFCTEAPKASFDETENAICIKERGC